MVKVRYLGLTVNELAKIASDLDAENAKLRELVLNLYACASITKCDECPYAEEPCDFNYDMRELGIEVSE